jgi:hemerythrin-like metal-binding protein
MIGAFGREATTVAGDDWGTSIEMGISFADSDHRVLLRLLNLLEDSLAASEDSSVVASVLDSLAEYTVYHFRREEAFLEACGYPDLADHRRVHERLRAEVAVLMDGLRADATSVAARELRDFVKAWLIEHILGDDMAYRDFCRTHSEARDMAENLRLTDGFGGDVDWPRLKVLLVEDNPNFRRLLETLFGCAGIRGVRSVGSGREALDHLFKRPADVVLCDVVMDDMDGVALAREAFRVDPLTRFVFVSGLDGDVLRRRASSVGVDAVLEKPISASSLFGAIAKALKGAVRPSAP